MAAKVAVYFSGHRRSRMLCEAMAKGILNAGDRPISYQEQEYRHPTTDVAVFYGLYGNLRSVFHDYQKDGKKAVYIDLGYWGRRDGGGRYNGYHKVSVNGRHPTEYFQKHQHSDDRIRKLGIEVKPWKEGGTYILLAGMSAKSAGVEGFGPEEWERSMVEKIRAVTDRPIIYRPKPSWRDATPIDGTRFSPREEQLEGLLEACHAIVTHHSNVAVEGIAAGIPAFCWMGVARPMSSINIGDIEKPRRPEDRDQWLSDIAYTQWTVNEMAKGHVWRYLKDEKVIP